MAKNKLFWSKAICRRCHPVMQNRTGMRYVSCVIDEWGVESSHFVHSRKAEARKRMNLFARNYMLDKEDLL